MIQYIRPHLKPSLICDLLSGQSARFLAQVVVKGELQTVKDSQNRIENKLDATITRIDDHANELARLRQQVA